MKVVPPITVTTAKLTSTTVPEVAPAVYAAGTSYALNAQCSMAGTAGLITVYKSLQAGNVGHTPSSSPTWWVSIGDTYQTYAVGTTYALGDRVLDSTNHLIYESVIAANLGQTLTNVSKWLRVGLSNAYAMFDLLRGTSTSVPGSMTVVLAPGERINALILSGLVASSISVSVSDITGVIYTYSQSLTTRIVTDWYDYFFSAFTTQNSVSLFNLPPANSPIITVTLTAASGNVSCSAFVLGTYLDIGDIQYEAESDVLNFSTVTRDFAGGTSEMVQRRNVPRTIQNIQVSKSKVDKIRVLRDDLAGTPAVWAGLNDGSDPYFESLLIIGFYKRFTINLKYPNHAMISLELEEI
jgi:hypothetical protein